MVHSRVLKGPKLACKSPQLVSKALYEILPSLEGPFCWGLTRGEWGVLGLVGKSRDPQLLPESNSRCSTRIATMASGTSVKLP